MSMIINPYRFGAVGAIEFIASNIASGDTVSIPPHAAGDFIVGAFGRHNTSTPPSLPSGWDAYVTRNYTPGLPSILISTLESDGSTSSVTSTDATYSAVSIYRNVSGLAESEVASVNDSTGIVEFPGLLTPPDAAWWALFIAVAVTGADGLNHITTPSGTEKRAGADAGGSNGSFVIFDSNGAYVSHGAASGFKTYGTATSRRRITNSFRILPK